MEQIKKLSILIPVYNEEATVLSILAKLQTLELQNGILKEVIVINDASTDNTKGLVDSFIKQKSTFDIQLFSQSKNQGKGAAIHKGIDLATGEYLIVQDADLEYDPTEMNELLKPVFMADADVVYGSRFIGGNSHRILFFWHSIGNRFLTFVSNAFTNLNLTDMETCYKLIRSDIAKSLLLKEKRFGFEPEVTAKLARVKNIRIYEIGISYYGRTYAEGKKIGWKDAVRALWCILKYNVMDRKHLR